MLFSSAKQVVIPNHSAPFTVSCAFQDCPSELNISHGDDMNREAMGYFATLGKLYDAHKDAFCGPSLFSGNLEKFVIPIDSEKTEVEFIIDDSINSKLDKLNIEGELKVGVILNGLIKQKMFQLSFLCGFIKAGGHCKYLSTSTSKGRETSASVHETINISSRDIINQISIDSIKNCPSATHVITACQWGAGATAYLTYKHQSDESQESINGKLELEFNKIKWSVKGSGEGTKNENKTSSHENFNLKFYVDALPNQDNLPQTVEEAITFMKSLPMLIKDANGGKGVPLTYTLTPLSAFRTYLKQFESFDRIIHKVDESIIGNVVRVFEEMSKTQKMMFNCEVDFKRYHYCVKDEISSDICQKLQELEDARNQFRKQLSEMLIDVRYGRQPAAALIDVVQTYRNSNLTYEEMQKYFLKFTACQDKIQFAKCLEKKKVIYVGRGTSLDTERLKNDLREYYAYFCDWSNEVNRTDNSNLFMALEAEEKQLIFIDLEANPTAGNAAGVPNGNRICHYFNERFIEMDCLEKQKKEQSKCYVKCLGTPKFLENINRPNNRVDVDLCCPQFFQGQYCDDSEGEWYCYKCKSRLEYDFNGNFHCRCGFASIYEFAFRCSHPRHGEDYVTFDDQRLKALVKKISPRKEINILLLGETGVGKTTWINSFANYLTYLTLHDAENNEPLCLIPSQFVVNTPVNGKFERKVIRTGEDKNENFQQGQSCTQQPLSHVFNIDGKRTVRIIDTPGIGDTRGLIADNQNFAAILNYVSNIKDLHGICILLKSNNSRETSVFKYCISELLANLHISAANNIAFCFTHTRSSFYRPGDTLPVLEGYIENLGNANENLKIDLTEKTIYGFDNEAFRFLCLLKNGETFSNDERANYEKSWEKSVKETMRLFSHFEKDITPHAVRETTSLNKARQTILTAAKPLADITLNIQKNIEAVKRQHDEVQFAKAKDLKLQGQLFVKHIGIQTQPLGHPRTVCNSAKCTKTKQLPNSDVKKVIYKQICHHHCKLENVTPEIAPNPKLQKCNAMNPDLTCRKCGCSWDTHLHITFTQEEVEEDVEDRDIARLIKENKSDKEIKEAALKSFEHTVNRYKQTQKDVDKILAKFASFLKKNAIMAYNDTIEDYLKLNIATEEQQLKPNWALVEKMKEQLLRYREQKQILDERLAAGEAREIQPHEILALQKDLEKLPLIGETFRNLFNATVNGKETNYNFNEQYFDPYKCASEQDNGGGKKEKKWYEPLKPLMFWRS
uniref:G domain-containing protein n=1 Tax=Panagrolaimus davidi TaxID=227884 RepID=A0A914Q101_9BILA